MAGPKLDLLFLLNQSAYAFAAQLGEALGRHGVNVREFCVLMKAAEEERTQNHVAELAMLDKTTMVSTLDRLERSGLAERQVSGSDRRARVVVVTPKGRKVLAKASQAYDDLVDQALSELPPAARATYVESFEALVGGPWATPSHTQTIRRRTPTVAR